MPFKSKAQQRYMFSQHPRMAKRWAKETQDIKKLPEKLHPEETVTKTAEGLFFEKRARSKTGNFFRELPGRDEGDFHKRAMMGPGSYGGGAINVSPTGAPMGGSGASGANIGSLYGTGEGDKKKDAKTPAEQLKEQLAKKKDEETAKEAARSPSDWDADSGLPIGHHRPSRHQPEGLEAGGDRFHANESLPPEGEDVGTRHGLAEAGSMKRRGSASPQMGKHASAAMAPPRFLGTSFVKTGKDWSQIAETGTQSVRTGLRQGVGEVKRVAGKAGRSIKRGIEDVAESPAKATAAAGLGGLAGLLLLRRGGKGLARLLRGKPAPPPSLAQRAKQYFIG